MTKIFRLFRLTIFMVISESRLEDWVGTFSGQRRSSVECRNGGTEVVVLSPEMPPRATASVSVSNLRASLLSDLPAALNERHLPSPELNVTPEAVSKC